MTGIWYPLAILGAFCLSLLCFRTGPWIDNNFNFEIIQCYTMFVSSLNCPDFYRPEAHRQLLKATIFFCSYDLRTNFLRQLQWILIQKMIFQNSQVNRIYSFLFPTRKASYNPHKVFELSWDSRKPPLTKFIIYKIWEIFKMFYPFHLRWCHLLVRLRSISQHF